MRRLLITLAGVVLCALSLSNCAASSPPHDPTPSSTSPKTSPPTPSQAPTTASPQIKQVASPWQPGMFQNGVQLYWHTTGPDESVQQAADRALDYIVGLGANSVGITFPVYTDGPTPSKVYAGGETPTPAQLELVIKAAKQRHLRIMLRPIIDEANIMMTPNAWRGNLTPANIDAWFASYQTLLLKYVDVAVRNQVDEFVAGTELFSLQNHTDKWRSVSDTLRHASFTGAISYSVNWDSSNNDSLPFDAIGLDAYPAIQLGDDASVEQLTAALTDWIDQQPASIRSKLTIQEAGIPAISGMYPHPWFWGSNESQNLTVQAHWFTAVYQAAKAAQTTGVYYWMVDSNVDPSKADATSDPSGSFIKRPAEESIKNNFSH